MQNQPADSPVDWIKQHLERYDRNPDEGHDFNGYPALLITTRGRKTGTLHRTPLIYGRDGDRVVVVASNGASPTHPNWYLNLSADPQVSVQIKDERFTANATTSTDPGERERLWELMASIFPTYRTYATQTEREIPVVVLERA